MRKAKIAVAVTVSAALWWQFDFTIMAAFWLTVLVFYSLWNA